MGITIKIGSDRKYFSCIEMPKSDFIRIFDACKAMGEKQKDNGLYEKYCRMDLEDSVRFIPENHSIDHRGFGFRHLNGGKMWPSQTMFYPDVIYLPSDMAKAKRELARENGIRERKTTLWNFTVGTLTLGLLHAQPRYASLPSYLTESE